MFLLATRMIGVAWKLLVILLNSLGDDFGYM